MAKRKKKTGELRTSIRLPADDAGAVADIQEQTGWTPPESIAFLVRAGAEMILRDGAGLDALRRLLAATIEYRESKQAEAVVRKVLPSGKDKRAAVGLAKRQADRAREAVNRARSDSGASAGPEGAKVSPTSENAPESQ